MNEANMSKFISGTGSFSFSGANINTLESSEYTLVVLALDSSVSIKAVANDLTKGVKDVIASCQHSPRSDNLLVRLVKFDESVQEYHGFKELNKCALTDYDNCLTSFGNSTSLFDGVVNAVDSVNTYGKELSDSDYTVNAIVVVLTDGDDNSSFFTANTVKQKLSEAVGERKLESLVSILVGVNTGDNRISKLLKKFADEAGFTKYIDVKDATPKELAKLAQFISKSISSQSQSLGTNVAASLSF